ncbi:MAG: nuclear transport factor 2 family protein [Ferruginibacter sp.]|nr:nuclear transport factor 2 family protein [Ferruginibacter sp.]
MDITALNKQVALTWIDAFNAHDLEKLLALYHEDAIHYSPKLKIRQPETNGFLRGKSSLRLWWADAFQRLPQLHYQLKNMIVDEEQLMMEYLRLVTGEEAILVAEVLEIEDGIIIQSRVYLG